MDDKESSMVELNDNYTDKKKSYFESWKDELINGVREAIESLNNKSTEIDDNHKRIEHILHHLALQKPSKFLNQPEISSKCVETSVKSRIQGNIYFKSNETGCLDKALEHYTKSVAYAPAGSMELSLACANRSAVLFKVNLLDDCLKDVMLALNNNYPDNLKAKLFFRKALCLKSLIAGDHSIIYEALQDARKWLDKMSKEDQTSLEKLIKIQERSSPTGLTLNCNYKWGFQDTPPKLFLQNSRVPGLSDAVDLKYSDKYGRHIVATRDIKPGEILAIQKPFVDVIVWEMRYKLCWHCSKQIYSAIPCDNCSSAVYCSKMCLQNSEEEYHNIECHVLQKMLPFGLPDNYLLGLRLTIKALKNSDDSIDKLRNFLAAIDTNTTAPEEKGFIEGKLHPNDFASVYALASSPLVNSDWEILTIVWSVLTAYFLTEKIQLFDDSLEKLDLDALKNNDAFKFLVGLIEHNNKVKIYNTLQLTMAFGRDNFKIISYAITPALAFFNHSCVPMLTLNKRDEYIVSTSICPIKKGEQIFDNYGAIYYQMSKEKRHAHLTKFNLACDCEACINSWSIPFAKPHLNMENMSQFTIVTRDIFKFSEKLSTIIHTIDEFVRKNHRLMDLTKEKDDISKLVENVYKLSNKNSSEVVVVTGLLEKIILCSQRRYLLLDH